MHMKKAKAFFLACNGQTLLVGITKPSAHSIHAVIGGLDLNHSAKLEALCGLSARHTRFLARMYGDRLMACRDPERFIGADRFGLAMAKVAHALEPQAHLRVVIE
jgi:hypothetical protein